ncbi:MAG: hypothetical protein V1914_02620 [archaeon]
MRNKLLSLVAVAGLGFIANCDFSELCYYRPYQNTTSYEVIPDRYTPNGIGLDDPKKEEWRLDAGEVDWQVDDFEACLNENFAKNPVLSEESNPVVTFGDYTFQNCVKNEFYETFEVKRDCLVVKVPDDLYESKCSDQMLFPCDVNPQACLDKGVGPTEECPCNCRATVQDDNYIITNPALSVFRGELARIVTTCNNPWIVEQLRGCLLNPHLFEE